MARAKTFGKAMEASDIPQDVRDSVYEILVNYLTPTEKQAMERAVDLARNPKPKSEPKPKKEVPAKAKEKGKAKK